MKQLPKNTDYNNIAPGGRIESYWNDKGLDLSRNKIIELVNEYNLAGIEFGNWVPQNERIKYVEDIYKGLPTLCHFLNISRNELGQGVITIAFGARGRSPHAAAHFEPRTYAINLTRTKGRRSFLHEYIHALDRILYEAMKDEYGSNPQLMFSAYFATDGKFYLNNSRIFEEKLQEFITETGVRGAIARLLWNLCFYVEKKGDKTTVKWSKFYDNCKKFGEYWAYPWEILARSFEAYFSHSYLNEENSAFTAVAKSTKFFAGKGVYTREYPKGSIVLELDDYFEDVIKCFSWVLDAKKLGEPNSKQPTLTPKSSIINEATDLDLARLRKEARETKKPEKKKIEVKKPEKKKIEVKKPERKKPEKVQRPRRKVAQTEKPEITKDKAYKVRAYLLAKDYKKGKVYNYATPLDTDDYIEATEYAEKLINTNNYHALVIFKNVDNKYRVFKEYFKSKAKQEEPKQTKKTKPDNKKELEVSLVDTLINSMELFDGVNDFLVEFKGYLPDPVLKHIYESYWQLVPTVRIKWDVPEWENWLSNIYKKFDHVLKIGKDIDEKLAKEGKTWDDFKKENKPESKTQSKEEKFVGEGVTDLFNYLAQARSGAKFTDKWGIKPNELVDELNDFWENKTALSIQMLLNVNDKINSMNEYDKKDLINDFTEYCMLATQNIHTHKIDKRVVSLLKKMKSRDWQTFENKDFGYRVWPYVRPSETVEIDKQKSAKLSLEGLRYVIDRIASDDEYRPAMQGVYYDLEQGRIIMTDSYKLITLPTKYIDDSIVEKLHANSVTMIGVKNKKNFEKEDGQFPNANRLLEEYESNKDFAFRVVVDEEIEKCKQLQHMKKFSDELTNKRSFIKISENGDYFCCSFPYYKEVMETFKKFGKFQLNVFRVSNSNTKGHIFEADDIQIILMPLRMDIESVASFDPKLYDFKNTNAKDTNIFPIFSNSNASLYQINVGLVTYCLKLNEGKGLSDLHEKGDPKLFDDLSDIEVVKPVEFLGDDITAPDLEVNTKYDLPAPMVNNNAEVVTVQEMRKNKIKPLQLPSKYKSLLGNVPNNFRMLLWGAPGHGKSSLALTIGNDLARKCKVLFVSAEESVQSATLQNRIKRFKATSRNLMFNDTTNPAIIESIIAKLNPKFIIIDSVNVMQGKVEAIIDLMLKYPDIGFIIIAQATKDHKRYSGLGSLAHAVDIVVNVKSGTATAEKNRYAPLGSMPVKGITI